jgi:hypothetical protein
MPTVVLTLRSDRGRLVSDTPTVFIVGITGGQVHQDDIDHREADAEVVCRLPPDRYRVEVSVPGYLPWKSKVEVAGKPMSVKVVLKSRCTRLPAVGELSEEQLRLLKTLDGKKTHGEIWNELSENKAATFFQITHALSAVTTPAGASLSSLVSVVSVLGGASLTARDKQGKWRRVIGWRMHVAFAADVEADLLASGFKRDSGTAHQTHSRFGFTKSHREKKGAVRLQVTTDKYGTAADVDVDISTPYHMSAPHDVYEDFVKRFPETKNIYKVV